MLFRSLRCSFCRRHDSEVNTLVAGPRVYICDRCAYETIRLMEATPPADGVTPRRRSTWSRTVAWMGLWRPMRLGSIAPHRLP
jgi:hypothetical protein